MESPPRDHGIAGSARRGAIMGKEAREHVEGPPAPSFTKAKKGGRSANATRPYDSAIKIEDRRIGE